eukprot:jgi/Bigna1/85963/estExt_fgenesh1_pg.C_70126
MALDLPRLNALATRLEAAVSRIELNYKGSGDDLKLVKAMADALPRLLAVEERFKVAASSSTPILSLGKKPVPVEKKHAAPAAPFMPEPTPEEKAEAKEKAATAKKKATHLFKKMVGEKLSDDDYESNQVYGKRNYAKMQLKKAKELSKATAETVAKDVDKQATAATAATPVVANKTPSSSEIKKSNTSTTSPTEAYGNLLSKDSPAGSWMVMEPTKEKSKPLKVVKIGEGIESMKQTLSPEKVLFACIAVHGVDVRNDKLRSTRTKVVQVDNSRDPEISRKFCNILAAVAHKFARSVSLSYISPLASCIHNHPLLKFLKQDLSLFESLPAYLCFGTCCSGRAVVQVNFVGANVPAMRRMMALSGKKSVSKVCKGVALVIQATKPDEITTKELANSLLAAGGAHKPSFYDFGNVQGFSLCQIVINDSMSVITLIAI